jgi:site-specific recombinase XerD
MQRDLEPITATQTVEMFVRERRPDVAASTAKAYQYRLNHFIRWCDEREITNLNELTGRDLHEYRLWRRDDGDLNRTSLKTQMDTLRVFVRFCERIDGVHPDLHTKVVSPSLAPDEDQRDAMLEADTADDVLAYLRRFRYASRDHLVAEVLWHTGMRTGSLRAVDIDDYHPDDEYVEVRHRPETDTPLKNKQNGERLVALTPRVCEVIDEWIAHRRPAVEDEYGRSPLVTTRQGRPHPSTIRDVVYRVTRPCVYAGECPHDRDVDECDAADGNTAVASTCPSTESPHAVRRGSITHHLSEDVPEKIVVDRMNVSADVLDAHYDRRSEEVKLEQRRSYLLGNQ